MLHTVIKSNSYQDSLSLMVLTSILAEIKGVKNVSAMMGTPANKEIMRNTGLLTPEAEKAGPADIFIVVDTDNPALVEEVSARAEAFLANQASVRTASAGFPAVRSWDTALKELPDANMALISIPGQYAAEEAKRALGYGLHVFLFSDNVPVKAERELKELGRKKGLLVMGPDCGTGIIGGLPLAFANIVNSGAIGIAGASGTGIQETASLIHRLGSGISHAIGTGGRDLSEEIGGITMLEAIKALAADPETGVILVIAKPPAPSVRSKVIAALKRIDKPAVAAFMGEKPAAVRGNDNIYYAWTLEDAASLAADLARQAKAVELPVLPEAAAQVVPAMRQQGRRLIKGLYSGGTLAAEAAMLIKDALGSPGESDFGAHKEGVVLHLDGHEIIDLGDDFYTQGRPHPMIDPRARLEMLQKMAADPAVAVILFDVVLGCGAHEDMAGVLAKAIEELRSQGQGQCLFVAAVCGTDKDPQPYQEQVDKLRRAGVLVEDSNAQAARLAVAIVRHLDGLVPADAVRRLLAGKPRVINAGLRQFADNIHRQGGRVVQFDWAPPAGGNPKLAGLLSKLK